MVALIARDEVRESGLAALDPVLRGKFQGCIRGFAAGVDEDGFAESAW